jgi:hypothetical protein
MADYTEIKGNRIQYLDSDPTLTSANEGQVWYNSTTGTLRVQGIGVGAWSSTTSLPGGKYYGSGAGEKDSTLVFAGLSNSTTLSPSSFEYNGSGWITEGNIITGRRSTGGTGTATAALCVGGFPDPVGNKTEEYDGSSWTETGNVPRFGHGMGVFGTQTAAYACGGGTVGNTTTVDVYNGSTWTSGTALSTARFAAQGAGTTSAGLIFGGDPGFSTGSTATESWDGTSWTTLANLNTGRTDFAGGGTQTAALGWAGRQSGPTDSVKTEEWNGTSWTEVADYPTGTNAPQGSSGPATSTAAVSAGGAAPGPVATVNEYNFGKTTITPAAWSSGGTLGTSRDGHGAGGTQTTGIVFGGSIAPGNTANTEEYDGSTWTEVNNLNTARRQTTGVGTQTAALCAGGFTTANSAATEEYDGTSWTSSGNLATNRRNGGHFGVQTASLYCGGYEVPDPNSNVIQEYNGSTWTNLVATIVDGGNSIAATGTTSAGLLFGGSSPTPRGNQSEEWDGTSMSAGGTMLTSKYDRASANQSPSTDALSAGGGIPAQTTVEGYDGTAWSTRPSISTATNSAKGGGTASAAFIAGGGPGGGPLFNTTQEFTGETSATRVSTLTTS